MLLWFKTRCENGTVITLDISDLYLGNGGAPLICDPPRAGADLGERDVGVMLGNQTEPH
jgi:hypothetical protein